LEEQFCTIRFLKAHVEKDFKDLQELKNRLTTLEIEVSTNTNQRIPNKNIYPINHPYNNPVNYALSEIKEIKQGIEETIVKQKKEFEIKLKNLEEITNKQSSSLEIDKKTKKTTNKNKSKNKNKNLLSFNQKNIQKNDIEITNNFIIENNSNIKEDILLPNNNFKKEKEEKKLVVISNFFEEETNKCYNELSEEGKNFFDKNIRNNLEYVFEEDSSNDEWHYYDDSENDC